MGLTACVRAAPMAGLETTFKVSSSGCRKLEINFENDCQDINYNGYTCQVKCINFEYSTATCECESVKLGGIEIFVQDQCNWSLAQQCHDIPADESAFPVEAISGAKTDI